MLERILVPLDGSKGSELVLSFLRRLPIDRKTKIIVARIVEPGAKDPGPGFAEESLEFAETYLRQVASGLSSAGMLVGTAVRSDHVAEALVSIVKGEGVSMIALSTHGRTASVDRPFGGVTEQLIRTSPVPILAVPSFSWSVQVTCADPAVPPLRSILVTTDGSSYGDAVAPLAAELATRSGAEVTLLQLSIAMGSESRAVSEQAAAEKHLQGLARIFARKGIPTHCVTGRVSPVNGILEVTKNHNIDLIAMSTHGRARHFESAVGSVTQAVLHQAGIPVLMVRPGPPRKLVAGRPKLARSRRR
jgi:nucleotide-binding universal stress UspA family protein